MGPDQTAYGEARSQGEYGEAPMTILLKGIDVVPTDVAGCVARLRREVASTARTLCKEDHSINTPFILNHREEYRGIVAKLRPFTSEDVLPGTTTELSDVADEIKALVDSGPAVAPERQKARDRADGATTRLVEIAASLRAAARKLGEQ
jgi:hypothetical protein